MFKALEIHTGYLTAACTIILHILAVFYLLYILKIGYDGYLPMRSEKKVVWYQAPELTQTQPSVTPPLVTPPKVYQPPVAQQPEVSTIKELPDSVSVEHEGDVTEGVEHEVSSARKMRSRDERRASWAKPPAPAPAAEKKPLTASTFMDLVAHEQAAKRQAQAVYTKQEAVAHAVAAQMREITEGRLRHKFFSALQMIFDMNQEEYYSPVPIMSNFDISIVINSAGEIVAVEVLRSTGRTDLDNFLVRQIQKVKKIALPASKKSDELRTLSFPSKVTIPAGSGHIIFDYKDASGMHIQ